MLLLIFFLILNIVLGADEDLHTIEVHHSLDNQNSWNLRATLSFQHLKHSSDISLQDTIKSVSALEIQQLKASGVYSLKIRSGNHVLIASVPACSLFASQFRSSLLLSAVGNSITSIDLVPATYTCTPEEAVPAPFKTKIELLSPAAGLPPPRDPEPEPRAPEEQSGGGGVLAWLTRNWMYVLPALVVIMISNILQAPEEAGGGGK